MLFREHLCARFWRRLGLQSCWGSGVSQPCVIVLHRAFPWYWPVHPDIYGFALYAVYPSRHLWLCLVCRVYVCLVYVCIALLLVVLPCYYIYCLVLVRIVLYLAVPKMLFREHLCARFWRRLGLQSCWGSGVSQPCPTVLHRAFPWYWPVHPDIYGFAFDAFYALHMPCIAFCLAVPKMLFREHLCTRFWHRLGLQSCWGSGVSQPCLPVLHKAFPWYWPVHPDIYGFALYAVYPSRHLWLCLCSI